MLVLRLMLVLIESSLFCSAELTGVAEFSPSAVFEKLSPISGFLFGEALCLLLLLVFEDSLDNKLLILFALAFTNGF